MRLALSGEQAAYRTLLDAAARRVRAFLRRRLPPVLLPELEDLVQETLLSIHTKRHSFHPEAPFTPWLLAIARHRLIDKLRRRKVMGTVVALDAIEELPAPGDPEAATARVDLDKLLATLPPHLRVPIELTRLEGLSVADAAARAGMSVSAIKVGVHRGLKRLALLVREKDRAR